MPDGILYQQVKRLSEKASLSEAEQEQLKVLKEKLAQRNNDLSAYYSLEEISNLFN